MKKTILTTAALIVIGTAAMAQKNKSVKTEPPVKMDTVVYTGNTVKSYNLLLLKFDSLREKLAVARLYDEAKLVDQLKSDIASSSRAVLQAIIPDKDSEPMPANISESAKKP